MRRRSCGTSIDRYATEVKRQLDVLNRHLATRRYLAGDEYSIADIATWPWYGALATGRLYSAGTFCRCTSTPTWHVGRRNRSPARRQAWASGEQGVRQS